MSNTVAEAIKDDKKIDRKPSDKFWTKNMTIKIRKFNNVPTKRMLFGIFFVFISDNIIGMLVAIKIILGKIVNKLFNVIWVIMIA